MLRMIKVLLSLAMALMAIVYALQNVVNLDQAVGAIAYVISNVDHQVYPESVGPSLDQPVMAQVVVWIIITLEIVTGAVLLKGTADLFRARGSDAMGFDMAKKWVIAGAGLGMLVWFGLFHFVGGAVFQMWQTELGDGSLTGAFWYGSMMALCALYISLTPDH